MKKSAFRPSGQLPLASARFLSLTALHFAAVRELSKNLTVVALSALAYLMILGNIACSRDNSIYQDAQPDAAVAPTATMPSNLPEKFFDQSVGLARAQIQPNGISANSKSIELKISAGTNPVGAFNGGVGQGSKAILGFDIWRKPILQVFPLGHDFKLYNGSETIGVSIQLDLQCDGSSLHHIIALGSELNSLTSAPDSNGYSRVEIRHSDPVWNVDAATGQPLRNPDDDSILVPVVGAPPASLNSLLARYPGACVSNGTTSAVEVAKNIPTAGIQWSLGRDDTTDSNSSFISRFKIGALIFEELE